MYKSKLITGLSVDQPDTVMCNVGKSIYHLLWNKTSVWICFGRMRRILIYILTVLFFNWCCFCAIFITPCECFSAGWFLQQLSAMCWKLALAFLWLKVLFFQKGNSERFTHCDFFSSGKKKNSNKNQGPHRKLHVLCSLFLQCKAVGRRKINWCCDYSFPPRLGDARIIYFDVLYSFLLC